MHALADHRLQGRIVGLAVKAALLPTVALWMAAYLWLHFEAADALERKARTVAAAVAATIEGALALGMPLPALRGANEHLQHVLQENPDLRLIAVLDRQSTPIFFGQAAATVDAGTPATWSAAMDAAAAEASPFVQQAVNFDGRQVGTVVVTAEADALFGRVAEQGLTPLLMLVVSLLAVTASARLVLRQVCLGPLGRLQSRLDAGAAGRYAEPDEPPRSDEIGRHNQALALVARRINDRANHFRAFAEEVRTVAADPAVAAGVDMLLGRARRLLASDSPVKNRIVDEPAAAPTRFSAHALRIRITLLVLTAVVVTSGGMAFTSYYRERLVTEAATASAVKAMEKGWYNLADRAIAGMAQEVAAAARDPQVVAAVIGRDSGVLGALILPLQRRLEAARVVSRIEVATLDGGVLYGGSGIEAASLFGGFAISSVNSEPMSGLARTPNWPLAAILAAPIRDGDKPVGVMIFVRDVMPLVQELSAILGAEVLALDLDGQLLESSDSPLPAQILRRIDLSRRGVFDVKLDRSAYAVTATGLPAIGGGRLGYLVSVRDVSEHMLRSARLHLAFTVLTVLGLGSLLWLFYHYLRHLFAPLDTAITALNTLSRGETTVFLDAPANNDEVGRIAGAVRVFRDRTIALARVAEERSRRRRRQERLIRRQMLKLAETLPAEARDAMLKDLDQIEREALSRSAGAEVAAELDALAIAFQKMADRVREQHRELDALVQELREALKSRTSFIALQQELEIARELQLSLLPKVSMASSEFDAHALMTTAKEVGGDFYDFFFLSPRRIGLVVADVSGKGVPAALFMAVSRTLLKATAMFGESPGRCLEKLNDLLEEGNEKRLFVTVFYGILDLDSGVLTYSNGGHNAPLVLTSRGEIRPLPDTDGIALAVLPGLPYQERTTRLRPGDAVVMYTDGVTEAVNDDMVEFGEDRLAEALAACAGRPAAHITAHLLASVQRFAAGAAQADDITCLTLGFRGAAMARDVYATTLRNDLSQIAHLAAEVEAFLRDQAVDEDDIFHANLCLDEVITNVVSYGYDDGGEHAIEVEVRLRPGEMTVTVDDDGRPYDPLLLAASPDLASSVEDRPFGGLGVHFVRTFMDRVTYNRDGGHNRIIMGRDLQSREA